MKVKITEEFRYEGEEYEQGREVDLPEQVARSVIEKGYGKRVRGAVEGTGETPEGERRISDHKIIAGALMKVEKSIDSTREEILNALNDIISKT